MRKFILGFLLGALMFGTLTLMASDRSIVPNPFRILVDGQERQVEAYLIDGRTFLQLRGIAELLDNVEVDFVDGEIIINTKNESGANTNNGVGSNMTNIPVSNNDKLILSGEHITFSDLHHHLLHGHSFRFIEDQLVLLNGEDIVVQNIPFAIYEDRTRIPLSFVEAELSQFFID